MAGNWRGWWIDDSLVSLAVLLSLLVRDLSPLVVLFLLSVFPVMSRRNLDGLHIGIKVYLSSEDMIGLHDGFNLLGGEVIHIGFIFRVKANHDGQMLAQHINGPAPFMVFRLA